MEACDSIFFPSLKRRGWSLGNLINCSYISYEGILFLPQILLCLTSSGQWKKRFMCSKCFCQTYSRSICSAWREMKIGQKPKSLKSVIHVCVRILKQFLDGLRNHQILLLLFLNYVIYSDLYCCEMFCHRRLPNMAYASHLITSFTESFLPWGNS